MSEAALIHKMAEVADLLEEMRWRGLSDDALLKRAVTTYYPPPSKWGRSVPRWSIVAQRFGVGSTYAHALCLRYNVDPHEPVKPQ